ncbi:MAG: NUDIX hydrolase [Gammaproteobacteria bacterium]|nr:NUDIX hydrolase [Gammaproteobacteria bacterium]
MILGERTVYQGRVITVKVETVRLPNGRDAALEIVHHPGGAAIAAIDAEGRICLLRQFRHAGGGYVWELPAGKLEPPEPPLQTAQRELGEEAGVSARHWESLGSYLSSPGVFTEVIHLYLARELEPAQAMPEDHEVFEVHWVPLATARQQALSGELRDGKTVLGILRAATRIGAIAGPPPGT